MLWISVRTEHQISRGIVHYIMKIVGEFSQAFQLIETRAGSSHKPGWRPNSRQDRYIQGTKFYMDTKLPEMNNFQNFNDHGIIQLAIKKKFLRAP